MQRHVLARGGMNKGDGSSMQVESDSLMAVKFITQDGTIQSFLMGTVHAQLMRTACHGRESEQRFPLMY